MNKKQLSAILQKHKLWLETDGKEGERANLYGANLFGTDLRGANLSGANLVGANLEGASLFGTNLVGANLVGAYLEHTSIISGTLGRHFYFYHEGYLNIGCHGDSLENWLENYREIGKNNEYSEKETELHGNLIKFLYQNAQCGLI